MSRSLKIGILGTRGIPNRYGGFEECAEFLSQGLVVRGHRVWVYNPDSHPFREAEWNGVRIIRRPDHQHRIGTAGQFFYDRSCLGDARRRGFDICLHLGYTSNSVWHRAWPREARNVVNMDGLEWKRDKYNPLVRLFLRRAERWAATHADVLIADSPGIQGHLRKRFGLESRFIAYGAVVPAKPDPAALETWGLEPFGYHMVLARMEPEYNLEAIVRGYLAGGSSRPLFIVGGTGNRYGSRLRRTYEGAPGVRFAGALYDRPVLDALRYHSFLYFHGHSVGGTNPSLLEAMAGRALVAAHDNEFNRFLLGRSAHYFSDSRDVAAILRAVRSKDDHAAWLDANVEKIRAEYSWDRIVGLYEAAFLEGRP